MKLLGGGATAQPGASQTNVTDILRATDPDPVGTANKLGNLPSTAPGSLSPFATGFFNPENRATSLTPGARLASQGSNAMNQWASLGGVSGVDPNKLAALQKAKIAAGMSAPPRTNYGEVQQPEVTPSAPPPHVGSWLGSPATGWQLVGPKDATSGGGNLLGTIPPGSTPAAPPNWEEPQPPTKAVGKGRKPRNPFGAPGFGFGVGVGHRAFSY